MPRVHECWRRNGTGVRGHARWTAGARRKAAVLAVDAVDAVNAVTMVGGGIAAGEDAGAVSLSWPIPLSLQAGAR